MWRVSPFQLSLSLTWTHCRQDAWAGEWQMLPGKTRRFILFNKYIYLLSNYTFILLKKGQSFLERLWAQQLDMFPLKYRCFAYCETAPFSYPVSTAVWTPCSTHYASVYCSVANYFPSPVECEGCCSIKQSSLHFVSHGLLAEASVAHMTDSSESISWNRIDTRLSFNQI